MQVDKIETHRLHEIVAELTETLDRDAAQDHSGLGAANRLNLSFKRTKARKEIERRIVDEEEEENFDHLDDLLFGDDACEDRFPVDNGLAWGDHFLNGRESGGGPDVDTLTPSELLSQGYSKQEIAEALRDKAEELLK